jgi:hypothetical protein
VTHPVSSCFRRLSYFIIFPYLPYFRSTAHSFFHPCCSLFLFPILFSVSFVVIASLLPVDPFTFFPMLLPSACEGARVLAGGNPAQSGRHVGIAIGPESFATHQGSSGQQFSLRISLVTRLDGGQIAGGAFTSPFSIDLSRAITPLRAVCCVEALAPNTFAAYACQLPGWALPHTVRRIPSSHPCCVPLRRAWRLFRRVPPAFTSCVAFRCANTIGIARDLPVRRTPSSHPCCVPLRRAWRLFRRLPPAFTSCVAFPLCKHDWHSTRLTIAVIVVIMCVLWFAVRRLRRLRVSALHLHLHHRSSAASLEVTSRMSLRCRRPIDFARVQTRAEDDVVSSFCAVSEAWYTSTYHLTRLHVKPRIRVPFEYPALTVLKQQYHTYSFWGLILLGRHASALECD